MDPTEFIGRLFRAGKSEPIEIVWIGLVVVVICGAFLVYYYINIYTNKELKGREGFLFRINRLGLSSVQLKIISSFLDTLKVTRVDMLLRDPRFFEETAGRYLRHLYETGHHSESIAISCRDIAMIYEKFYHPQAHNAAVDALANIELDKLLSVITGTRVAVLAKLVSKGAGIFNLRLLANPAPPRDTAVGSSLEVSFWRIGDALYTFTSVIISSEGNAVAISIPEEFTRSHEFRHPYVDVLLPAEINRTDTVPFEEEEQWPVYVTLYQINEHEMVVRSDRQMDINFPYSVSFTMMDFKIFSNARIISSKTVRDTTAFYYTFKFEDLSESALRVLKKYLYEHL